MRETVGERQGGGDMGRKTVGERHINSERDEGERHIGRETVGERHGGSSREA